VPFAFSYNSNSARHFSGGGSNGYWIDNASYLGRGGWSYDVPLLSAKQNVVMWTPSPSPPIPAVCVFYNDYVFADPRGSTHALALSVAQANGSNACQWQQSQPPPDFLNGGDATVVANAAPMSYNSGHPTPVTVTDPDGTVYSFSNSNTNYNPYRRGSLSVSSSLG
jgi:hypothetical protein